MGLPLTYGTHTGLATEGRGKAQHSLSLSPTHTHTLDLRPKGGGEAQHLLSLSPTHTLLLHTLLHYCQHYSTLSRKRPKATNIYISIILIIEKGDEKNTMK